MNGSDAPAGPREAPPRPGGPSTPESSPKSTHDEMRLARSPWLRAVYGGLGLLCVALGALGVVLPGWPTTVWLLVAAFFFARSSPRFYRWLLRHRLFGPLIRDVRAGLGIPLRAKMLALSMIILFAGTSGVLLWARPWLSLLVFALAGIGAAVVLRQPTRRPGVPAEAPREV